MLTFQLSPNHLLCYTVMAVRVARERKTSVWSLPLVTMPALLRLVTKNPKARHFFHSLKSHRYLRPIDHHIVAMNLCQKSLSWLVSSTAVSYLWCLGSAASCQLVILFYRLSDLLWFLGCFIHCRSDSVELTSRIVLHTPLRLLPHWGLWWGFDALYKFDVLCNYLLYCPHHCRSMIMLPLIVLYVCRKQPVM